MKKSKSFFHALQPPLDGLADGLLMHTLGLGNFLDTFSENDVGIDPPALDFGQRVEGVPQAAEHFHALQQLLRGRFMQAGGIFDPVLAVQRILRLVPGDPPLVGHFITGIGQKDSRHIVRNLNIFVLGVPVVKVAQVDSCHGMYLHIVFCGWVAGKRYGGLAGSGTLGSRPAPWDCLSQSWVNKKRLLDTKPHKRTEKSCYLNFYKIRTINRKSPVRDRGFF